ncbi:hypothetical protein ACFVHW_04150 [Streptomyces sp. NPDC127110]|uniref:hypothetical protein n=1 Tax=Streptomyces sp. NPDC127110 TaxID=3345362 RepID=UPI003628B406
MIATTVNIRPCTTLAELHCHYDRQFEPQNVYIELDLESGLLHADYNAEVGNAVPFEVFHGRTRRYPIGSGEDGQHDGPVIPSAEGANRLLEQLRPLAERVLNGSAIEWDGNNMVGRLDEDAVAAEEEILELLQGPDLGDDGVLEVWTVESMGEPWSADDAGITGQTSDAELAEIEERLLAEFRDGMGQPTAVIGDLDVYLRSLRDGLADED